MIELSLFEISKAVKGRLIGTDKRINQISTDSRSLHNGDVFLALKGPNFDGHKFVEQACIIGCSAVIVEQEQVTDIAQIVVADSHQALGDIAAYVKQKVNPKTVAITGSSGKTTVKEMIAAILKPLGNVLATKGNFNNDIGVPLTLLNLQATDEFAVIELGANHQGEIEYTTQITKPDVAIINNIAAAHLEGFGSLQGVAIAKGEIFAGLSDDGVAIYNLDTPHTNEWQWRLLNRNVKTFSAENSSENASLFATDITLKANGCACFELHCSQGVLPIDLSIPGKHNVGNSLAAAGACMALGATLEDVKTGLASMAPVKGRANVLHLSNSITLIDDTYNANVESTKAAIDLLASYQTDTILVLGDFGELGKETQQYHQEIGEYAKNQKIDWVFTLGEHSSHTSAVYKKTGRHFKDRDTLNEKLAELLNKMGTNKTVLIKGSRSAKMELVVNAIQEQHKGSLSSKGASC